MFDAAIPGIAWILRSQKLAALVPLVTLTIAALATSVVTGCADLKSAATGSAAEGAGGDGLGVDSGASFAPAVGGADAGDGGTAASGDPRFPLWPTPADAPSTTDYVVTNGPDGAIVKDLVTGLAWQDTTTGTYDFDGASAYCDALVYDGASDWRMPTRIEAISIMSIKPGLSESAATGPAFTAVSASCTWTASRPADSTLQAFSVSGLAVSPLEHTSASCAARCVRGGAALATTTAKLYVLDATTARDPVTGLVWERNPPSATGTLALAQARCNALALGSPPRSMRLPTFKELAGIVDEARSAPASGPVLGLLRDKAFSSTPRWTVDFEQGAGVNGPAGLEYGSRCVGGP